MKNKNWKIVIFFSIVVSCILSVGLVSQDNKVANIILNDLEAIAQSESGGSMRYGYVDNPQSCVIKETYICEVGFKIPEWIPYIGGTECYTSYVDEVEFPGTRNDCIYTGNRSQMCDYYRCTKN